MAVKYGSCVVVTHVIALVWKILNDGSLWEVDSSEKLGSLMRVL